MYPRGTCCSYIVSVEDAVTQSEITIQDYVPPKEPKHVDNGSFDSSSSSETDDVIPPPNGFGSGQEKEATLPPHGSRFESANGRAKVAITSL